jgi:hypothetical protein
VWFTWSQAVMGVRVNRLLPGTVVLVAALLVLSLNAVLLVKAL